ncbi:MAG: hypothetical protein H7211_13770 [Aquabacterium sp.]|nr:hypothetical protein [Ferruginibacter sp.]
MIEDAAMLLLLKEDRCLGWHPLYEKYSGMMYGSIMRLTDDKNLADKILTIIFLRIAKNGFALKDKELLYLKLLQFTCSITKEILAKQVMNGTPARPPAKFPLLDSIVFEAISFEDAFTEQLLTAEECRKKLHLEVTQMRLQMKNQPIHNKLN